MVATVGFEAHHHGFAVTIRDRVGGNQIVHEYGCSEDRVKTLIRAHGVDPRTVIVRAAQA